MTGNMYKVAGMDIYDADRLYFEWTTILPTEPGWYWVHMSIQITMAYIFYDGDQLGINFFGDDRGSYQFVSKFNETGWRWLGPLPEPEPPKEAE